MYKQILCPIDGSLTSNCGVNEAIRLAKDQNANLRFLHVIDTYFPIMDMTGDLNVAYMADIQRDNGEKTLKEAVDAAQKAGVVADSKIVEAIGGRVSEFVVSEAKAWPADLIAMGTHGLRGIKRLVMGSDAQTIVQTSPIPVLLVKDTSNN